MTFIIFTLREPVDTLDIEWRRFGYTHIIWPQAESDHDENMTEDEKL